MAKRFTETDKWNDTWYSSLSPTQKYVFLYLIDVCDNAGFYEINIRKMEFDLGIEKDKIQGALKGLERGLIGAEEVLWIKNFLRHQKNLPLNPTNPAHRQIIRLIEFKLDWLKTIENSEELEGALKGLLSPIGTGIGTGTSKIKKKKEQKNEKIYVKGLDIERYEKFIDWFNDKRKSRFIGQDEKAQRQFMICIKKGYDFDVFEDALTAMIKDPYHIETNFTHITPEFITRPDKLEKFANVKK